MALDKHPELRAAVHKLLGPSLPEGVWVTHRSTSQSAPQMMRHSMRDQYTVDLQLIVCDTTTLEALLQMIHRNTFTGGTL